MSHPQVAAAQLAPVFSTAMFTKLAAATLGQDIHDRLAPLVRLAADGRTLAEAFEFSHALLAKHHRVEYVFKNRIVSKLIFGKHSPRTASALLELRMGESWADVVVVNGTTTTYEIKTDLDQFSRLVTQLPDYTARSEFVNLVTSERRAAAAERHLPPHVGIIAIRGTGTLATIRAAESNIERMTAPALFSTLRTREAVDILTDGIIAPADLPSTDVGRWARKQFAAVPLDVAHRGVVRALRRRGATAAQLTMSAGFPPSLRALAYATELSAVGRSRLLERLASPAIAL